MRGDYSAQMSRPPTRDDFFERQSVYSTTESLAESMHIPDHIYIGNRQPAGTRQSTVRWSMEHAVPRYAPNEGILHEHSAPLPSALPTNANANASQRERPKRGNTAPSPVDDAQKPRRRSQPALVPATYEVHWVRATASRAAAETRDRRKEEEEQQLEGIRGLMEEVAALRQEVNHLREKASRRSWGLLAVQLVVVVCVARKLLKHWPQGFQGLMR